MTVNGTGVGSGVGVYAGGGAGVGAGVPATLVVVERAPLETVTVAVVDVATIVDAWPFAFVCVDAGVTLPLSIVKTTGVSGMKCPSAVRTVAVMSNWRSARDARVTRMLAGAVLGAGTIGVGSVGV